MIDWAKGELAVFLKVHWRIGYLWLILVIDFLLAISFLFDCVRFARAELNIMRASTSVLVMVHSSDIFHSLSILFGLIIALPIFISILRSLRAPDLRHENFFFSRANWIMVAHVAFSMVVVVLYFVARNMELLGGMAIVPGGASVPDFNSVFLAIVNGVFASGWSFMGQLVIAFAPALLSHWATTESVKLPPRLKKMKANALILDLGGEFFPVYGSSKTSLTPAVSPEIPYIHRLARRYMIEYQEQIAGSVSSAGYLQELFSKARKKLAKLFFHQGRDDFYVEIFRGGTSRALEVALTRLSVSGKLILSPYEHESELRSAEWVARQSLINREPEIVDLSVPPSFFEQSWDRQISRFIKDLNKHLSSDGPNSNSVLLLSEVHYATGVHLPVSTMVKRVRDEFPGIRVVVDGAHALGNVSKLDGIGCADYYVCSAHKWLLCPEPCGILIYSSESGSSLRYDGLPPDSWGEGRLPISTAGIWTISLLLASLEAYDLLQQHNSKQRVRDLRDRCISLLENAFYVVGKKPLAGDEDSLPTLSNMLSFAPAGQYGWKMQRAEALELEFEKKGFCVSVITVKEGRPWLRLGFSHFNSVQEVDHVSSIAKSMLI